VQGATPDIAQSNSGLVDFNWPCAHFLTQCEREMTFWTSTRTIPDHGVWAHYRRKGACSSRADIDRHIRACGQPSADVHLPEGREPILPPYRESIVLQP